MSSSVSPLQGGPDGSTAGPAEEVLDPAARPFRRTFTAEYRARVVAEYEAAPQGQKAAVLRREGLYQSQVREWRVARDAVAHGATGSRRAHRATGATSGGKGETARLRTENQRLTRELAKSAAVVEIMGNCKVSPAMCMGP